MKAWGESHSSVLNWEYDDGYLTGVRAFPFKCLGLVDGASGGGYREAHGIWRKLELHTILDRFSASRTLYVECTRGGLKVAIKRKLVAIIHRAVPVKLAASDRGRSAAVPDAAHAGDPIHAGRACEGAFRIRGLHVCVITGCPNIALGLPGYLPFPDCRDLDLASLYLQRNPFISFR